MSETVELRSEEIPPPINRRRGQLVIGESTLASLLDLPEGIHIVGIHADWPSMSIRVMVEGDELDEIPEGCEPPVLMASWTKEILLAPPRSDLKGEDVPYVRLAWRPPDPKDSNG